MKNKGTLYLTQTAVMLSLLITVQFATGLLPIGQFKQFITGALVNFILFTCVFIVGLAGGLTVAAASPFFALIFGITPPLIHIVPFMAVGNSILVLIAWLFRKFVTWDKKKDIAVVSAGLAAAAAAKALFLWFGVVVIMLPLISWDGLGINEKQNAITAAVSFVFSWPQLVTGLSGGALTMTIIPPLKKALAKNFQK